MKKTILFLLIAVVTCGSLSACSSPSKMDLFNQTLDLLQEYYDVPTDMMSVEHQTTEKRKNIRNKLTQLGFEGEDNTTAIDQEFIKGYLEQHSEADFLEAIGMIQRYCIDQEWTLLSDSSVEFKLAGGCICQEINEIMNDFLEVTDMQWIIFDPNQKNGAGYYTENPQADPQPYTEKVEGDFYSKDGTNASTEERTNTTTIEYYGDFALSTKKGYIYHQGRYEWVNGEFYDELPSWESYTYHSLWYKGAELPAMSSETNGITIATADKYKIFPLEQESKFYGVLETTDTNHTYSDESHTFYDIFWRSIE